MRRTKEPTSKSFLPLEFKLGFSGLENIRELTACSLFFPLLLDINNVLLHQEPCSSIGMVVLLNEENQDFKSPSPNYQLIKKKNNVLLLLCYLQRFSIKLQATPCQYVI